MDEHQQAVIAAEDATSDLSPEARRRKEMRLKKREQRAKEKQKKEAVKAAKKAEQFEKIEQYWDFNRARLTEEQRTAMEVRQLEAWDLMECMQEYCDYPLDETSITTEQDLADTIEEVKADVAKFGLCNSSVLSIPRVWCEDQANLRSHFSKPTLDLVSFGMFQAITERLYEDFRQKFMVKHTVIPQYWESITCTCGATDHVQKGTAADYRRTQKKYLCHVCREAGRRSAAQANIRPTIRIGNQTIVDGQGKAHPDLSDPHHLLWPEKYEPR